MFISKHNSIKLFISKYSNLRFVKIIISELIKKTINIQLKA